MVAPINFLETQLPEHWATRALESALTGYKAGGEPRRMRQAEEKERLSQELLGHQTQHAEDINQFFPEQQQQGLRKGELDIEKAEIENEMAPWKHEQEIKESKQKTELAQALLEYRRAQTKAANKKAEGGSGNSLLDQVRQNNLNASVWKSTPLNVKQQSLALLNGAGISGDEASRRLHNGETVDGILRSKGFNDTEIAKIKPKYISDTVNLREQRKRDAVIAELNVMEPEITEWMAPYIGTWSKYSPKQIVDSFFQKEPQKVARYLAGIALQPEIASLRIKAMGGQIGEGALHTLVEKALGDAEILRNQVTPEVYKMMQHELSQLLNKGAQSSRDVIYGTNPYSANSGETTDDNDDWVDEAPGAMLND